MNAPVRKGRKYDQVLEGARSVFMREGFEGASVDQIARDAHVSKATLYSYFPDKQSLFLAVITHDCEMQARGAMSEDIVQKPVPEALYAIAHSFVSFFLTGFALQMFRLCVAESMRFPELGRAFYETGPQNAQNQIIAYLETPRARAELEIEDSYVAADQLLQMCRTDLLLKRLFGVVGDASEDEIDRISREAVATFLARYQRRP
ncbi:TetR/AcrR family transcriptional regulator [Alterinioella nitratireducens]|uniref:TetR/AcrR family transcriptional regulator n=1 Tax=Alterinioella nitratireducens TaxID=2735915 RepID=UPI0015543D1F|nr:TetR/AcrR family transcriptional regulator C-terminal domain-containing protein [Alterinioella nitratireducens]NPD18650.1 TetR/AcrR family transcriptional regulator [Alterinioella nitratireducens]